MAKHDVRCPFALPVEDVIARLGRGCRQRPLRQGSPVASQVARPQHAAAAEAPEACSPFWATSSRARSSGCWPSRPACPSPSANWPRVSPSWRFCSSTPPSASSPNCARPRSMEALMKIADVRTRVRRGGRDKGDRRARCRAGRSGRAGGRATSSRADLRLNRDGQSAGRRVRADRGIHLRREIHRRHRRGHGGRATAPTWSSRARRSRKALAQALSWQTAMDTEIGRISDLAQSARGRWHPPPPLEQRLDHLGHRLVWLSVGLAALAIGAGRADAAPDLTAMIQDGCRASAVASVPEGAAHRRHAQPGAGDVADERAQRADHAAFFRRNAGRDHGYP